MQLLYGFVCQTKIWSNSLFVLLISSLYLNHIFLWDGWELFVEIKYAKVTNSLYLIVFCLRAYVLPGCVYTCLLAWAMFLCSSCIINNTFWKIIVRRFRGVAPFNYLFLMLGEAIMHAALIRMVSFCVASFLLVDEAHKLKNLDCKLASCLKQLDAEFRLLLTVSFIRFMLLKFAYS